MVPPPLENPVVPLEEPVALDSIPRLQVGKPRLEIESTSTTVLVILRKALKGIY